MTAMATPDGGRRNSRGTAVRLFVTVWLIFAMHATTNVVRETYLAIALGTHGSVRVDEYLGLHPDLFEIPGRGGYINNNPGASMFGAVAYVFVRPAIALAVRIKPEIAAPKPPAVYDDPRPNRTRFMNAARARGLDVTLGLAAIGIQVLLMAPLGALATLLMWQTLRGRLADERQALGWALAYAFATPILFRSAFLNQNVIIAHLVLVSWVLMTRRREVQGVEDPPMPRSMSDAWHRPRDLFLIGLCLGLGLLNDYSAVPLLVVFGLWILSEGWRWGRMTGALRFGLTYVFGALGPIALLLGYQWVAFGSPWFPAQRYMPPTEFSVRGWFGFTWPTLDLIWGNLFDLRYGLFAFCPLLLAGLATPWIRASADTPSRRNLRWAYACFAALYLFSCANQFANLQWNTGVRYMVPAVPLLFLAAVPVLRRLPALVRWVAIGLSLAVSLAVTMTREDIPTALAVLSRTGPTLPVLIVAEKMASGYALHFPWWTIVVVYALLAGLLWLVWRGWNVASSADA